MLRTRLRKKSLTSKEFQLENKGFARGTSYVGIQYRRILFFREAHCRVASHLFTGGLAGIGNLPALVR
jgi:hypothetical protein